MADSLLPFHICQANNNGAKSGDVDEIANLRAEIDRLTRRDEIVTSELRAANEENSRLNRLFELRGLDPKGSDNASLRTIEIKKVDGGIGVLTMGNLVDEIEAGGAAAQQGDLRVGDQIISINGISVETASDDMVDEIIDSDPENVRLVVVYNPERRRDLISYYGNDVETEGQVADAEDDDVETEEEKSKFNEEAIVEISRLNALFELRGLDSKGGDNGNLRTIEINKINGGVGFFAIGALVDEIIPGGPAALQGDLRVGDQIISINGISVETATDARMDEIIDCDDPEKVRLVVAYNPERRIELIKWFGGDEEVRAVAVEEKKPFCCIDMDEKTEKIAENARCSVM